MRCNQSRKSAFARTGKGFGKWSGAAAKFAKARMRDAGLLSVTADVGQRLRVCEQCPLRTVHRGVAWCGKPIWLQMTAGDVGGCGCPIADKARDPAEHCPMSDLIQPGRDGECGCKWCAAGRTMAA